jgi:hypothetical protein
MSPSITGLVLAIGQRPVARFPTTHEGCGGQQL